MDMLQVIYSDWFVLGAVFGSILLFAMWLARAVQSSSADRRFRTATTLNQTSRQQAASIVHVQSKSRALRLLEPLQKAIVQSDPRQVGVARERMIQAGYYGPSAIEVYFTLRLVLGVGMAVICGLSLLFTAPETDGLRSLFFIILAAAIGYYAPAIYISSRISSRHKAFQLGMPDALDMLLVGVEGGLSLQAAMRHVADQLASTHPVVCEQFQTVILEFQAGRSRADALRGMADRMQVQETKTLASMIVQAETLGTSLSQTLRVMADEMRIQRMLKAEKTASELPVKMALPLVLCIFPSVMAVALVPALLTTLAFFAGISSE